MNAIVLACSGAAGEAGEVPVSGRPQKEFLRDLLLAQGIQKSPGSELDDLLARYRVHVFGERKELAVSEF